MRRTVILSALVVIAGLGLLAPDHPSTVAQDATSAPAAVGMTTQLLGNGQPGGAPGEALGVRRNTFAPGGFVPRHEHPGVLVLHVETGELTYTVVEGIVHVQRAGTAGTPGPTEELGPGQETVLRAGDWLFE